MTSWLDTSISENFVKNAARGASASAALHWPPDPPVTRSFARDKHQHAGPASSSRRARRAGSGRQLGEPKRVANKKLGSRVQRRHVEREDGRHDVDPFGKPHRTPTETDGETMRQRRDHAPRPEAETMNQRRDHEPEARP